MSQLSYRSSCTASSRAPTLKEILYASINDIELILAEKPQFREGLARIMSNLIAHECRLIGF